MSRAVLLLVVLLVTAVAMADEPVASARAEGAADVSAPTDERTTGTPPFRDEEADAGAGDDKAAGSVGDVDADGSAAGDQAPSKTGAKVVAGMSILGNREAPKSLVIVPWKSSVIGDSLGVSTMLDDSRQPVDREVFMRALRYHQIRSDVTP